MNRAFLCLAPGQIGSMRTRNRIVYPAMETNYCDEKGNVTDRFIAYHRTRGAGGIGLCITEATMITPEGRSFPNQLGIYSDELLPGLCKFTEEMHSTGAKAAVQLFYPGRQTNTQLSGIQPMGPSETVFSGTQVRAMTHEDIKRIKQAFADAAVRAVQAGFDAIELHGGNGYIFQQFHSRFTNKREDEYGGSLLNRIRFTKEVVRAIRASIGMDFPIIMRLGVYEPVEKGLDLYEGLTIAKLLVKEKIDALHVTAGMREAGYLVTPPAAMPEGTLLQYAKQVREAIAEQKPVIGIGRILSLRKADEAIARGDVDFVTMGRAFIADPQLIEKTLSNQEELIVPCLSCNEGCMGRLATNKDIACAINPEMGKEYAPEPDKSAAGKTVVIIGAGPAGSEAALAAKAKGNRVIIVDKQPNAGGKLFLASLPPFKQKLAEYAANIRFRLDAAGIEQHYNFEANLDNILKFNPDTVIIATGAEPVRLPVHGMEKALFAEDALQMEPEKLPEKIAVIGGGLVGAECAEFLAAHGKTVDLLEMKSDIALDMEPRSRQLLMQRLKYLGVKIYCNAKVNAWKDGELVFEQNNSQYRLRVDAVIVAVGYTANNKLAKAFAKHAKQVKIIGDADKPASIFEAAHNGHAAGMEIM